MDIIFQFLIEQIGDIDNIVVIEKFRLRMASIKVADPSICNYMVNNCVVEAAFSLYEAAIAVRFLNNMQK